MDDRYNLDEAVLEMLGIKLKRRRRELIDRLYEYLKYFFELTRRKEEKAIANKKRAKRRGAARPSEIAAQIYQEILDNEPRLLRHYDDHFLDSSELFDAYEIPSDGVPESYSDMFIPNGVKFKKGVKKQTALIKTKIPVQDDLIVLIVNSGLRGFVRVPHDEDECRKVYAEYARFVRSRDERLHELIENRTGDEEMQAKVLDALIPLILRRH